MYVLFRRQFAWAKRANGIASKLRWDFHVFFNEEQHGKADGNLMTIGVHCTLKVPGNYALDGTPVKLMRMHLSEAWLNSECGGRPADWIGIGWIDMDRGSHTCLTRTLTPFAHPGRQYHDVWCMIPPCGHNMF